MAVLATAPPPGLRAQGAATSPTRATTAATSSTSSRAAAERRRITQLVWLARSYGRLRRVTPAQAEVVRLAAEHDRRVLPRWQRDGDSMHWTAEPGAYAGLLAWRSREHWLATVVPAAIAARPELLRALPTESRWSVSTETLRLYLRTLSLYAHATGRRCIVRPDRLAELMGVSKRTVHYCQRAARRLELVVVVQEGRMLTELEVMKVRAQGSRQRGLAAEQALVVPAWLPRAAAWSGQQPPRPARVRSVDNSTTGLQVLPNLSAVGQSGGRSVAPPQEVPTGTSENSPSIVPSKARPAPKQRSARDSEPPSAAPSHRRSSRRPAAVHHGTGVAPRSRQEAAAGPPTPSAGSPAVCGDVRGSQRLQRGRTYDPAALALGRALVDALPWLAGVSAGRLERMLRRYATRPSGLHWTAGDVLDAIEAMDRRLGRASMTRDRVRSPWGLLASYLKLLDPDADHPRAWLDLTDPDVAAQVAARPVETATGRTAAIRRRNRQLLEEARRARGPITGRSSELAAEARAAVRRSREGRENQGTRPE